MSIQDAIDRIDRNIKDSLSAVSEQGVTVPSDANSDTLPGLIRSIPTGTQLPELTTPASASDILSGKEAIDEDGEVITGTIATKTSSDLTASGPTVTVPAGYYASQASKSVTKVARGSLIVTVSTAGLITAKATQSAGYVSDSGTKSTTKQLTTQAATTITPSTSSQTAVAKNVYTTGAVTVAAIPSNYEDVTDETTAYTTKLASLETAITALEAELEGKASGGGSTNIEVYTGTINNTSPMENAYVLYLDANLNRVEAEIEPQGSTVISVLKDSFVLTFTQDSSAEPTSGCSYTDYTDGSACTPFIINNTDFVITFN